MFTRSTAPNETCTFVIWIGFLFHDIIIEHFIFSPVEDLVGEIRTETGEPALPTLSGGSRPHVSRHV